ncbi:MAG: peptide chain release factor N(5)-glutamine methyltransferase [Treponema sp.]|nr:peptide chain release factor N(5)-glutamine methyltransferase [Treponema sp.]
MTVNEVLAEGTSLLASGSDTARIDTPALDSSILLAHILNLDRSDLITRGNETVSEQDRQNYKALLNRRISGECVAYITGHKEFYGLEFNVNPGVLVPRPDTEILVETAINICKAREKDIHSDTAVHGPKVLDLCTGSGAIAIALKHEIPNAEVWASDISPKALETAKANCKKLLRADSGPAGQITFLEGDLFGNKNGNNGILNRDKQKFDFVLTNPPYVPTDQINFLSAEVQFEPKLALDGGTDGLDIIKKIIQQSPRYLSSGGILLMEADPNQMPKIRDLLEENNFGNIKIYKDLVGMERVIGGTVKSIT